MKRYWGIRASAILLNFLLKFVDKDKYFICPANVCPIVLEVFKYVDQRVLILDIDGDSLCLDQRMVIDAVSANPKIFAGMLYVRTYGSFRDESCFFDTLKKIKEDFVIIDDKCLCLPEVDVSFGNIDMVLYSTGYAKVIDIGCGAFAFLSDKYCFTDTTYFLMEDVLKENSGKSDLNSSPAVLSYISNFDSYFSDVESCKINILDHKEKLNRIYEDNIPDRVKLNHNNIWRFNIVVDNKQEILQKIFESGLFASSHYKPLVHDAKYASFLYSRVINLFNDLYFTEDNAYQLCKVISKYSR
jgi:hypothetical protein